MLRYALVCVWLASSVYPGRAATLERLSMDDLVSKATSIVRGRVTSTWTAPHDSIIHTYYRLSITSRWKGAASGTLDLSVPGGTLNGRSQTFSGTPQLTEGKEYIVFVWSDKNGGNHILGLTQGLFELPTDSNGDMLAVRTATTETMLDRGTGRPVRDSGMRLRLQDFSSQIQSRLPVRSELK